MSWLTWIFRALWYLVWFAGQIVTSNVSVVRDIVTAGQSSSPIIVRLPTRCRTETEVALLSLSITLTPGTLTIATESRQVAGSSDREYDLFVHDMYSGDADEARSALREMETRLLDGVRRQGAEGAGS